MNRFYQQRTLTDEGIKGKSLLQVNKEFLSQKLLPYHISYDHITRDWSHYTNKDFLTLIWKSAFFY